MALFDFGKVKATISALAGELAKLREEREQLFRRREEVEAAPACKKDLLDLLDNWVDRKAQDFPKKLEAGIDYYRRHPLLTLPESAKSPAHPLAVLTAVVDQNAMATLASFEASLFYLLGDAIKSGVRQAAESMDFSAAGPPRIERIEQI